MHSADMEKYQKTKTCEKGRDRRLNKQKQVAQAQVDNTEITANVIKVKIVNSFKYLGRILVKNDDVTRCIEVHIKKARQWWGGIVDILK